MKLFARATFWLALFTLAAPAAATATGSYPGTGWHPEIDGPNHAPAASSWGQPSWIAVAARYKGTNPTNRRSLWCADFLNLVLKQSGMQGTSSSTARSFLNYGRRLPGPRVGAIAVLSRGKNGGHVGIVTGVNARGNPTLISGNHGNRVAVATYPASRVLAYVWPTG